MGMEMFPQQHSVGASAHVPSCGDFPVYDSQEYVDHYPIVSSTTALPDTGVTPTRSSFTNFSFTDM